MPGQEARLLPAVLGATFIRCRSLSLGWLTAPQALGTGEDGIPPERDPPSASDIAALDELPVGKRAEKLLELFTRFDDVEAISGYSGYTDKGTLVFEGGDEGLWGTCG